MSISTSSHPPQPNGKSHVPHLCPQVSLSLPLQAVLGPCPLVPLLTWPRGRLSPCCPCKATIPSPPVSCALPTGPARHWLVAIPPPAHTCAACRRCSAPRAAGPAAAGRPGLPASSCRSPPWLPAAPPCLMSGCSKGRTAREPEKDLTPFDTGPACDLTFQFLHF